MKVYPRTPILPKLPKTFRIHSPIFFFHFYEKTNKADIIAAFKSSL